MLSKKISADYVQAMKSRDTLRSATLNFLRAQMKNVMIDRRVTELDDADVLVIIKKQVKQRLESIDQYQKGGRQDLADKEQAELEILREYLPAQMSADQLEAIVLESVQQTHATGLKDIGVVMKMVLQKTAGQADNAMVSAHVKKALGRL